MGRLDAMTIGIVWVAFLAARIAGAATSRMTSTFRVTSSAARRASRSYRPSAQRDSIVNRRSAFQVSELDHATAEGVQQALHPRIGRVGGGEKADPGDLPRRLRLRDDRRGEEAAGNRADEGSPVDH
jgi:hypothetical protein